MPSLSPSSTPSSTPSEVPSSAPSLSACAGQSRFACGFTEDPNSGYTSVCVQHKDHFHSECLLNDDIAGLRPGDELVISKGKSRAIVHCGCCDESLLLENLLQEEDAVEQEEDEKNDKTGTSLKMKGGDKDYCMWNPICTSNDIE